MKNNQKGFSIIETLVLVILVVSVGLVGIFIYSRQSNSKRITVIPQLAPTTVEAAADNFIIAKVGNDNFKRLYRFDKGKSSYANPKDSSYDFMAYHFVPLKEVTDYDDVIMVQVNRDKLSEVFADAVPDCVKNSSFCNFTVNKQKTLEIAKSHSLTADDVNVSWHNKNDGYAKKKGLPFVIVASSCKQNKSLFIDYRNGSILGTKEAGCGGTD